jgi:drug/metabolite transporter (DMT)-like permease
MANTTTKRTALLTGLSSAFVAGTYVMLYKEERNPSLVFGALASLSLTGLVSRPDVPISDPTSVGIGLAAASTALVGIPGTPEPSLVATSIFLSSALLGLVFRAAV